MPTPTNSPHRPTDDELAEEVWEDESPTPEPVANDEVSRPKHDAEVSDLLNLEQIHRALIEGHHEALSDPRNVAEGLDRAVCPPHREHLAVIAAGASREGLSAAQWRDSILDGIGPSAIPLLGSAEVCMRESGLWPWPN